MSARILVVDDLAPNRNLLEVKLKAEYYDVLTAKSGEEAIEIAQRERLDLILMDAMMPKMSGFEACRLLKQDAKNIHIPIIMVTALTDTEDRIRGLNAGADDFITKPINDHNLKARVRSLLRLKMVTDQLLTHLKLPANNTQGLLDLANKKPANILLVEDNPSRAEKISKRLREFHKVTVVSDPVEALRIGKGNIDIFIVSLVSASFDGLRLCSSLRFEEKTRDTPILSICDAEDDACLVRAYDIGVNDTIMRPINEQEMLARIGTLLRRKYYSDSLKENFNANLEMVVSDSLTGLGNRRYFDRAVLPLFEGLNERAEQFSIMVFDIDHFKRVNDILGHDMGDQILKEVAARLVTNMRSIDIVARYGGEEFMVAMPKTEQDDAILAAERVRQLIAGTPIYMNGQAIHITTSVGIAQVQKGELLRDVFRRADSALYKAKHGGRNQVKFAALQSAA